MSSVLTRCRVSDEQIDVLLSFMEDYPDFAAGKPSIYSRFSSSKLWRLLAERLNAAAAESGGSRKSPDKWCRYWADLKYRTRKKAAGCGVLGDLTWAEERLQNIFNHSTRESGSASGGAGTAGGRSSFSDEERKPPLDEEDMCSETEGCGPPGGGDAARPTTEELLAEAAMRSALAAEKQAEAVVQAVDLLRDVVALLRERTTLAPPPPPAPVPPPHPHAHAPLAPMQQHHHHRL